MNSHDTGICHKELEMDASRFLLAPPAKRSEHLRTYLHLAIRQMLVLHLAIRQMLVSSNACSLGNLGTHTTKSTVTFNPEKYFHKVQRNTQLTHTVSLGANNCRQFFISTCRLSLFSKNDRNNISKAKKVQLTNFQSFHHCACLLMSKLNSS